MKIFVSVLFYVAIPLGFAVLTGQAAIRKKGITGFEKRLIRKTQWITPAGLLITLVLIFRFQGNNIINYPLHIPLITIPLVLQTYLIFGIGYSGANT